MTNRKSTKKALLTSVLALLLCFSMLVGTTFAWFTDSVESGVNQILAGNLDVALYHTNGTDGNEEVTGTTKLFDEVALWEPGAMVWEKLTVKNLGSLALKYTLTVNISDISVVNGKSLADVLQVAVMTEQPTRENIVAAEKQALETFALKSDGVLAAETGVDEFYVAIYWAPTANDNDYNVADEQLYANIGVTLLATQATVEKDSFDEKYDKDATYPPVANVTPINNATIDFGGGQTLALNAAYNVAPAADNEDRFASPYAHYNLDFVVSFDKDIVNAAANLFVEYNEDGYQSYYIPTENMSLLDILTKDTDYRILNDIGYYYNVYGTYVSFGKNGSYNIGIYEYTAEQWAQFEAMLQAEDPTLTLGEYPSGTTMTIEVRLYETEYKGLENGDNGLHVYEETGEYIVIDTITYTFE